MKLKSHTPWRAATGSLMLGLLLFLASTGSAFAHGCTPGYWKQDQHFDSWPAPYAPGNSLQALFGPDAFDDTLLEALNYGGGPGVDGAKLILLRAAVAAILNAAHPDIDFGPDEAQIIAQTMERLEGAGLTDAEHRAFLLALAAAYDSLNNLPSCPLN